MAKLTVKQLFECFDKLTKANNANVTEDIALLAEFEFLSLKQAGNICAIICDDFENKPAYMVEFYGFYYDSYAEKYATLEQVESKYCVIKPEKVDDRPISGGEVEATKMPTLQGKAFIFTSAQNNTDVHKPFLKTLEHIADDLSAKMLISRFTYNKNGFQNGTLENDELHYDSSLTKYLNDEKMRVCDGLVWCGELNILPTAKRALTGFEQYTGTNSTIIPHAKIQAISVPTPKSEQVKMMYSTGTVTLKNYIQKTAGQRAENDHCYGALLVIIDKNGTWFAYQLQTNTTGKVYFLDKLYFPNGDIHPVRPSGVNWGDDHSEKGDKVILQCRKELLKELQPKNQYFNDLFDMTTRNHHNIKDAHFLADMFFNNDDSVLSDIKKASDLLSSLCSDNIKSHIVESNHDLALEGWLKNNLYDFRTDPQNATTYLELNLKLYNELKKGKKLSVLKYALTEYIDKFYPNIKFYNVDDSILCAGVECGFHGHLGANGSRGTPEQFNKISRPVNTGHTHACSVLGNVYTAGISGNMEQGYNKGLSSWSHTHILTYPNGFRTLLTMKKVRNIAYYRV